MYVLRASDAIHAKLRRAVLCVLREGDIELQDLKHMSM